MQRYAAQFVMSASRQTFKSKLEIVKIRESAEWKTFAYDVLRAVSAGNVLIVNRLVEEVLSNYFRFSMAIIDILHLYFQTCS